MAISTPPCLNRQARKRAGVRVDIVPRRLLALALILRRGKNHAGSVGIIMSGWLGAINYGVIVANDVDAYLMKSATENISCQQAAPVK